MNDKNVVYLDAPAIQQLKLLSNYRHKDDCERVGYEMAPDLCTKRGYNSEILLMVSLVYADFSLDPDDPEFDLEKTLAEIYATLGVIRWCLDQRHVRH